MGKTISFTNKKGGVGKTISGLTTGQMFVRSGLRVCFVDMDGQGNLSFSLHANPKKGNVWEVLTKEKRIDEVLQRTQWGDCLCFSPELAGADKKLDIIGKEYLLKEALDIISDKYDYIIIDTPPSIGIQMVNSLVASDYVVIPSLADTYSLIGIGEIFKTIVSIRKYCNPNLKIAGILITRYRGNTNISRENSLMIEETAKKLNTKVFASRIREAVAVREAEAGRIELYSHAPKSIATLDYIEFVKELWEDLNAKKES
jgi:chromosome partitioning protein